MTVASYLPGVPRPEIVPLCAGDSRQRCAVARGRRSAAIIANFIAVTSNGCAKKLYM